jgi:hypothetical protein
MLRLFSTTEQYQSIYLEVRVTGYYKAKKALEMLSKQQFYRGMFRDVLTQVLREGRDYASMITHRITGQLAEAHMYEYDSHLMRGWLYINPRVVYADGSTLRWPRQYGVYEHGRGGSHAFYERTYKEKMPQLANQGIRVMIRTLDMRLPPSD